MRSSSEHLSDLPHHEPQQVPEWRHEQRQERHVQDATIVAELLFPLSLPPRLDDQQEHEERERERQDEPEPSLIW